MNPDLIAIARRLERQGLTLEAQAVRALVVAYGDLSLSDLIALVGVVSQGETTRDRVDQLDQLMQVFDRAVQVLAQPPARVVEHLATAVTQGLTAGMEMLAAQAAQPELFDMFRLRPEAEIEYTRHAAERLTRYWGIEQTRLRNEVQAALLEGLERGQSTQQITARLRDRVDVSRSRAMLIVRNELGNASAYAQRQSQQEAGVTHYTWLTAGDSHVRDAHRARNGKTFAWDDPPPDGHPGQPILCRCVALAVIPDEFKE